MFGDRAMYALKLEMQLCLGVFSLVTAAYFRKSMSG